MARQFLRFDVDEETATCGYAPLCTCTPKTIDRVSAVKFLALSAERIRKDKQGLRS